MSSEDAQSREQLFTDKFRQEKTQQGWGRRKTDLALSFLLGARSGLRLITLGTLPKV